MGRRRLEVRLDRDLHLEVLQEPAVLPRLEAQVDLERVHLEVAAPPLSVVKRDLQQGPLGAVVLLRLAVRLVLQVRHKEGQALLALLQVYKADLAAREVDQHRLPVVGPRCRRLIPSKQMSRPHNLDSTL